MGQLIKAQESQIIYGTPPVPAHPAYCSTYVVGSTTSYRITVSGAYAVQVGDKLYRNTTVTVTGSQSASIVLLANATTTYVDTNYLSPTYGKTITVPIPVSGKYSIKPIVSYEYATTCFPASAGSPGTDDEVVYTPGDGWNAGARSIYPISPGQRFTAEVPVGTIGVIVGLAEDGQYDEYEGPAHAFLFETGKRARILESGVVKKTLSVTGTGVAHSIEIRRGVGKAFYLLDGVSVYESASSDALELYAVGILYSASDTVDAAELSEWAEGGVALAVPAPLLVAFDIDVSTYADLAVPAPSIAADAFPAGFNFSYLDVPAPSLVALQDVVPVTITYANCTLVMPAPQVFAVTDPYGWGNVAISVSAPLLVAADIEGYNYGALSTPIPTAIAITLDNDEAGTKSFADGLAVLDTFVLSAPVMVAFAEQIAVGMDVDFTLLFMASFADRIGVTDAAGTSTLESISFAEAIRFSESLAQGRASVAYAVDIATGAPREYSNHDFTHYVNLGTELYAARKDGLYAVGSGVANASLQFAGMDFGAGQQKRIAMAWVGIRTDGQVYLRVEADGKEYVYRAIGQEDVQRVELGKGLKARTWRMRLEIEDASYASLDSVEFAVAVSQRRTVGGGRGRR